MKVRLLIVAILCAASSAVAPAGGPIPQPLWTPDEARFPAGDDENVRLLAVAAGDADPRVRERAVRDLGQTLNPAAIEPIRKAFGDSEPGVRCAALRACVNIDRPAGMETVRGALGGDEPMAVWAMQVAREFRLTEAATSIAELLANPSARIRATALETLAFLEAPAPARTLQGLMTDTSAVVRLRAAENAMLLPAADAAGLREPLAAMAKGSFVPARAAAIAALGKFDFDRSAEALVIPALSDSNPLVRRAAVRAFDYAAQAGRVAPERLAAVLNERLTQDASPMVRLAAVRAAGARKCAGCAQAIWNIMLSAAYDDWDQPTANWTDNRPVPPDDPHYASRVALGAIAEGSQAGRDAVEALAAAYLPGAAEELEKRVRSCPSEEEYDRRSVTVPWRMHERNLRSACWLLGRTRSDKVYDPMLKLLTADWLRIDSNIRIELAPAVGRIAAATGDARGPEALKKLLKENNVRGRQVLIRIAAGAIPPPFNEEVVCGLIEALAEIKAYDAVGDICLAATMNVKEVAHRWIPAFVAARLPIFDSPATRPAIEAALVRLTEAFCYGKPARFAAAITIGQLRLKSDKALSALRDVVQPQSLLGADDALRVLAAAWAIQEITGRTPATDIRLPQNIAWILRKAATAAP